MQKSLYSLLHCHCPSREPLAELRAFSSCRNIRHLRSLLNISRLLALALNRRILHLLIGLLLLCLCGLLGLLLLLLLLLLGLALGLLLFALLGLFGLDLGATGLLLLLTLVVEALDDDAGGCAELLVLGDVLCLGGVLAVFVEPVLQMVLACRIA